MSSFSRISSWVLMFMFMFMLMVMSIHVYVQSMVWIYHL